MKPAGQSQCFKAKAVSPSLSLSQKNTLQWKTALVFLEWQQIVGYVHHVVFYWTMTMGGNRSAWTFCLFIPWGACVESCWIWMNLWSPRFFIICKSIKSPFDLRYWRQFRSNILRWYICFKEEFFSALGSNEILGVTSPDLFVSNPIGDLRCLSRLEGAQRSSKYREIAQHLLQTQQVPWFSQGWGQGWDWFTLIYHTWMKTGEIIRDFRFLCFILLSPNDDLPCRHQGFMWVLLATSLIFWGDDGTNPPPAYPSNCCKPTEFLGFCQGSLNYPF